MLQTTARQHLVDAMKSLLWDRGFESTSPGQILERSSVGQGSLYHHFRGKTDLAVTALTEVSEDMRRGVEKRLTRPEGSAFENLLHWLTAPRESTRGCPLGRLANESSVNENADLAGPIQDYFAAVQRMIGDALAQAQQDGEFDPAADIREIAIALIAIVQGGYVLSRLYADATYMERATRAGAAMLRARARPTNPKHVRAHRKRDR
jgi:TetR/AcrR family transcriptional repressor of nem operon